MNNSEIILIFGRRGCGKTTLAKSLIKKEPRVIVFDTLGEYNDVGIQVDKFEHFAGYCMKYRFAPSFKISYHPSEEDIKYIFSVVCRIVNELKNCVFVIEEIGRFCSASSYPMALDKLMRDTRHIGVSIIGITHRPTDVPKLFRGLATKIITFQQIEPSDIAYLEKIFNSEIVRRIRNLNKFEYIEYDGEHIIFKKISRKS